MSEQFIGEIRIFSFGYAPKYWAMANGSLLPINQNQALFSLLGTTYGGNGQTTFALPDLRDRTPLHAGSSSSGTYNQGETGGATSQTLTLSQLPVHSHGILASTAGAPVTAIGPENALPAAAAHQPYRAGASTTFMKIGLVQNSGGNQPHPNVQPYLALNFCIALQGIFPSQ